MGANNVNACTLETLAEINIPNQDLESIHGNAFQIACRNRIRKQAAKQVSEMDTVNFPQRPRGLLESPETARLSEQPIVVGAGGGI